MNFLTGDIALLLLRLVVGLIFVVHGWPKLRDLKGTAGNFEGMGFKPGTFWGTLVALVEFVGGLAIFFGLYTGLAALLIGIEMLVGIFWKMSRGQGLAGGYELDLILLAGCIALLTLGPGVYSIEYRLL